MASAGIRTTLKDVARAAQCSTAVVSTVINNAKGNTNVSPEMRERVIRTARMLGYRPNFASQSLVRRSTRTIGVYVPPGSGSSFAYRYESAIIRGIERVCQERSYDLLAINLGGNTTPEDCFDRFTERRIDGLVLLHLHPDADEWIRPLLDRHPRVVSVNYYGSVSRLATVNFDDHAATAAAVRHLAELGHRNIGYIGPGLLDPGPGAALRYRGFVDTMRSLGLPVSPRWLWDRNNPDARMPAEDIDLFISGEVAVDDLLALPRAEMPTALVCYGDVTAIHAVRQLKRRGLSVPGDVSVVGVDDIELCRYVDPPLTTIRQPLEDMGARAAGLLFERGLERPAADERPAAANPPELAPATLVVRDSTAPPRNP